MLVTTTTAVSVTEGKARSSWRMLSGLATSALPSSLLLSEHVTDGAVEAFGLTKIAARFVVVTSALTFFFFFFLFF
jgi:hypothetical protein